MAISFGTSDSISASSTLTTNNYLIFCWFKITDEALENSTKSLIRVTDGEPDSSIFVELIYRVSSGNTNLYGRVAGNDGGGLQQVEADLGEGYVANEWYLIWGIFTNGAREVYIERVSTGTSATNNGIHVITLTGLDTIYFNEQFNGSVDIAEAAIWDNNLTVKSPMVDGHMSPLATEEIDDLIMYVPGIGGEYTDLTGNHSFSDYVGTPGKGDHCPVHYTSYGKLLSESLAYNIEISHLNRDSWKEGVHVYDG